MSTADPPRPSPGRGRGALAWPALLSGALIACGGAGSGPGKVSGQDSPVPDTSPLDSDAPDTPPPDDTAVERPSGLVLLNEAVSDNDEGLTDGDGDHSDWVELFVPGPEPIDLGGWTLRGDGEATLTFPAGERAAGSFPLVFASGKGEGGPADELHAPFRLDAGGETLTLRDAEGALVSVLELPALSRDVAYGLSQTVTAEAPLDRGDAVRFTLAPEDGWTLPDHDDRGWTEGSLALGFDGSVAGGGDPINLAFARPTAQSSDGYGFTGAQAVDGDPLSFTHTGDGDLSPWWEVSLEGPSTVSDITLFNRVGCCPERLYNVVVTALDGDGAVVWTSAVLNPVAEGDIPPDPGAQLDVAIEPDVVASAVRVSKTAVSSYRSEWMSLGEVVVTGAPAAPYAAWIDTEVPASPVYVRARLPVVGLPTRVSLRLRYDDGLRLWIDGVSLLELQAGDGVATAEHDGLLEERWSLDPRLFPEGERVIAVELQNADTDDLLLDATLSLEWIETGGPAYFEAPTPGEPNGTGVLGFVAEPTFDPPRGFYEEPLTVQIESATPDATLVYTTDGSAPTWTNGAQVLPSGAGEVATAELALTTTATLRAAALREGYAPSGVATHSYLFLEDVIHQPAAPAGWPTVWDGVGDSPVTGDYEMDPDVVDLDPEAVKEGLRSIPTLSIVTEASSLFGPTGVYENSTERGGEWERAVSVEWILPDGSTLFQEDCGLRVHGYGWRASSTTPKHSLRLEFNSDYGPTKLEHPIFEDSPVERFDSIVLRAGGSKTWLDFRDPEQAQYLHDSFARDTARDMGKLDGHATYVHLYLNGLYWGLYNPVERPEADFGAEYLGGEADEYDAINRRTVTNEAVDGTLDAYNELLSRSEADLSTAAGLAAVEEMLDLDDLIDYMLIHQYVVNRDGPCCAASNNMRGLRRRVSGEQFRFFVWDMEYSLWDAADTTNLEIDVSGSISHVYTRLRDNADFRARYSERAHAHLGPGGALSPELAAARYAARADEIHGALLGESARWGDTFRAVPYSRDVEWQAEYDRLMTDYFPRRTDILIEQLRAAGLYSP